jgi:hypothetical protein
MAFLLVIDDGFIILFESVFQGDAPSLETFIRQWENEEIIKILNIKLDLTFGYGKDGN